MNDRPADRADLRLAFASALLGAAPFLVTAPFCGLYLDDYSFLRALEGASSRELWTAFVQYVPGRNLHIPFFYGLIELTGRSIVAMHLVGVAFDALNAAMVFLLIRRLTGLRSVALAGAAAFAVAPNHGETHFWITLIPQCQIPTALTLAAFLFAARGRLLAACATYAVALFTYDQVFFLWPLLLTLAWSRDSAPRRARYAAAAAGLLALNTAHIALRYLSPYASGGRPLIRFADFMHRCRDAAVSVGKGVLPWPTSSHAHWAWSLLAIALALAAAVWLHRAVRTGARDEAGALGKWTNGPACIAAAAAGAAWVLLSYLPNLFWYLSPRHNLLPSIGWSLALISLGAWAVSRSRRAAAALPWLACLFFATAAVSDIHEGTQWIDSKRLQDGFISAVLRLQAPVNAVFVIGAPRHLRRAPAFNLPHDVVYSAGRALGRPGMSDGDYQVTPTRRGVVYLNDLTLGPAEGFRWIPAAEVSLLSFDAEKRAFNCVSALSVERPDGLKADLPLHPGANCSSILSMPAEASLLASAPGASSHGGTGESHAGGLVPLRARVSVEKESTRLDLDWRVEIPPKTTVAFIPRLKDEEGSLLLDSVFPSRGVKRPYPMIWPLVDDLAPELHLKPGQTLSQTFLLRRAAKGLEPGAVLELDVFEISPAGKALPRGTASIPVSLTR